MTQPVQLVARITSPGATPEELDRLAADAMRELRHEQVESVEPLRDDVPPHGAKADTAITIGAISLAVLPQFIPVIIEWFRRWRSQVDQDQDRGIRLRLTGRDVEYDVQGSPEELARFVQKLRETEPAGGEE